MESRNVVFLSMVAAAVVIGSCQGMSTFDKRQADGSVKPAFSVGLTSMLNVTDKTDVVYDRVFLNLGNGYDVNTGVFTANFSGTYVFLYHGLGETNGSLWLDMYKNDQYVASAYAHVTDNYAAASNVMVLELMTGDKVHIRGHGSSILYGDPAEVYATFSGYLMAFKQKPASGQGTTNPI